MTLKQCRSALLSVLISFAGFTCLAAENPFLGEWELTIPGGAAGWLGVESTGGKLHASLLWGSGSVLPLASAAVEGDKLVLKRNYQIERTDAAGKKTKVDLVETITAIAAGDKLQLETVKPDEKDSARQIRATFSGLRQPPMPPAPDLSKVKFGEPTNLFNGRDLDGWRLTDPSAVNGWSVKDGLLLNNPLQAKGQPHKNYGNLRTDREFEDFQIHVEVLVDKDQNSGVYLRGIYEVQVADTIGQPLDPHNMGAVYSRIKPTVAAEKRPGEWQTLDITFVARHVTVVLNGRKIIDNQPVLGCTGGALWSDVRKPGPIYLQGDHAAIAYRSVVLQPVVGG